jgi:MYXO-CTERM domain-containing protein
VRSVAFACLLPALLVGAACSPPAGDATGEATAEVHSHEQSGASCSLSRDTILSSVGGVRRDALTRGFVWFDNNVPYSQSHSSLQDGYRRDCSGFVSMCWQVPVGNGSDGETTSSFASSSDYHFLDSYDDLIPGDAIDAAGHHVVLFVGWNDDAHSGICTLEEEDTALGIQFHVRSTSSLKGSYKPLRPNDFPDDEALGGASPGSSSGSTTVPSGSAAGDDDDDSSLPTSAPSPSTPSFPTTPTIPPSSGGGACVPLSTTKACMAAAATKGLQCGTVSDGCGGTINCDNVDGFGCTSDATCTSHKCVAKTAPAAPPVKPAPSSTAKPGQGDPDTHTQGEPGDVGDTGDGNNSSSTPALKSPAKPTASSSGCSAAPGSAGTGDVTGSAGLAFAVGLLLKRRRRAAQK